jgi:hypothetical protein
LNRSRSISGAARRCRSWFVLLLVSLIAAGCDSLLSAEAGLAERATVRISGEADVPVYVITSVHFLAFRDNQTGVVTATLLGADTVELAELPYSRDFNLKGTDRFLVRLLNPDTTVTADVLLEVIMDGRRVFAQQATLLDAWLQYISLFQPDQGP